MRLSGESIMGKENKTVYVVLGFLNHEDLTGYEIKTRIDASLSYFWGAGFGQIYPTLRLLEKSGQVSKRSDNMGQKMERIKYSITGEGRQALAKWLSAPVESEYVKYEILLKLFFGSTLETQKNIDNLLQFKEMYSGKLPVLKGYEADLVKVKDQSPDHLYYLLTVLFGEKIYKAYVEWADEAVELLRKSQTGDKGGAHV